MEVEDTSTGATAASAQTRKRHRTAPPKTTLSSLQLGHHVGATASDSAAAVSSNDISSDSKTPSKKRRKRRKSSSSSSPLWSRSATALDLVGEELLLTSASAENKHTGVVSLLEEDEDPDAFSPVVVCSFHGRPSYANAVSISDHNNVAYVNDNIICIVDLAALSHANRNALQSHPQLHIHEAPLVLVNKGTSYNLPDVRRAPAAYVFASPAAFRSSAWSPPTGTVTGDCLLATCTNDHIVRIHTASSGDTTKYQTVLDISGMLREQLVAANFDERSWNWLCKNPFLLTNQERLHEQRTRYCGLTIDDSPHFLGRTIPNYPQHLDLLAAEIVSWSPVWHVPNAAPSSDTLDGCATSSYSVLAVGCRRGVVWFWKCELPLLRKKRAAVMCGGIPASNARITSISWCSIPSNANASDRASSAQSQLLATGDALGRVCVWRVSMEASLCVKPIVCIDERIRSAPSETSYLPDHMHGLCHPITSTCFEASLLFHRIMLDACPSDAKLNLDAVCAGVPDLRLPPSESKDNGTSASGSAIDCINETAEITLPPLSSSITRSTTSHANEHAADSAPRRPHADISKCVALSIAHGPSVEVYLFDPFAPSASPVLLRADHAHEMLITSLHFQDSGRRLVSESMDGVIRYWDTSSLAPLPLPSWLDSITQRTQASKRAIRPGSDDTSHVVVSQYGLACSSNELMIAASHSTLSGTSAKQQQDWLCRGFVYPTCFDMRDMAWKFCQSLEIQYAARIDIAHRLLLGVLNISVLSSESKSNSSSSSSSNNSSSSGSGSASITALAHTVDIPVWLKIAFRTSFATLAEVFDPVITEPWPAIVCLENSTASPFHFTVVTNSGVGVKAEPNVENARGAAAAAAAVAPTRLPSDRASSESKTPTPSTADPAFHNSARSTPLQFKEGMMRSTIRTRLLQQTVELCQNLENEFHRGVSQFDAYLREQYANELSHPASRESLAGHIWWHSVARFALLLRMQSWILRMNALMLQRHDDTAAQRTNMHAGARLLAIPIINATLLRNDSILFGIRAYSTLCSVSYEMAITPDAQRETMLKSVHIFATPLLRFSDWSMSAVHAWQTQLRALREDEKPLVPVHALRALLDVAASSYQRHESDRHSVECLRLVDVLEDQLSQNSSSATNTTPQLVLPARDVNLVSKEAVLLDFHFFAARDFAPNAQVERCMLSLEVASPFVQRCRTCNGAFQTHLDWVLKSIGVHSTVCPLPWRQALAICPRCPICGTRGVPTYTP
jgi:Transcription factor IIIC subunit delta bet-propeller domain